VGTLRVAEWARRISVWPRKVSYGPTSNTAQHVSGSGLGLTSSCVHWTCSSVQHYCPFLYIFSCVCLSLSICAILLTVFDFSTYMVNKHLIIDGSLGTRNPPSKWYLDRFGHFSTAYGHYQQTDHTTPVTTNCILQCCPCNVAQLPSVLWCCWLGGSKSIWPVKNLSGGVLAWLSAWS